MPRVYVVPSWAFVLVFSFIGFAVTKWFLASTEATHATRSLVACEARAQASLVTASQCNGHLTTCLGSVSRIADELEIERVTF